MNKRMKKFGAIAASAAALTTLVSVGPVNADVSRVEYFTIQNNTTCKPGDTTSQFLVNLNVNNISASPGDITVRLYDNNGNAISNAGYSGDGYTTNITLGQTLTLDGGSSAHYVTLFKGEQGCSSRPAYGKITVETNSGMFMMNGETSASLIWPNHQERTYYDRSIIQVNGGKPF